MAFLLMKCLFVLLILETAGTTIKCKPNLVLEPGTVSLLIWLAFSISFGLSEITTAVYSEDTGPSSFLEFEPPRAFQNLMKVFEEDNCGPQ